MKKRIYKLEYYYGPTRITQYAPFKSYNEAFKYLYSKDLLPINVTFMSWRVW